MKTRTSPPSPYPPSVVAAPGNCPGCEAASRIFNLNLLAFQCGQLSGKEFARWHIELQSSTLTQEEVRENLLQFNHLLESGEWPHEVGCWTHFFQRSHPKLHETKIEQITSALFPPHYLASINNVLYRFELSTENRIGRYSFCVHHERFSLCLKRVGGIVRATLHVLNTNSLVFKLGEITLANIQGSLRSPFIRAIFVNNIYTVVINEEAFNITLYQETHYPIR